MISRHLVSSVGVAALSAGAAFAADMPVKAPVSTPAAAPVAQQWTGFYVGANLGYLHARDNPSTDHLFAVPASVSYNGVTGGAQAGFNFQAGPFVFGAEADINAASASGSATGVNAVNSAKLSSFATIRARGGLAFDRVFIYATGGFGYAQIENSAVATGNEVFRDRSWRQTPVWGGGIEVALTNHWSVKAEAMKFDFSSKRVQNPGYRFDFDDSATVARGGINYRF